MKIPFEFFIGISLASVQFPPDGIPNFEKRQATPHDKITRKISPGSYFEYVKKKKKNTNE